MLRRRVAVCRLGRAPLFGVVCRLVHQKGIELLIAALPSLLAKGGEAVVLGTGEPGDGASAPWP